MNINKVIANGQTIVDLTDTTATAGDVKLGKLFHDVSGALTSGTFEASGLEYEEGTITPDEDNSKIDIPFKKEHNEEPILAWVCDINGEVPTNSGVSFCVLNYTKIFGGYPTGAYTRHGLAIYLYRGTYNYTDRTVEEIAYNDDREASEAFVKYFINKTRFKIYTRASNKYWRAGRTYKWIAIWK